MGMDKVSQKKEEAPAQAQSAQFEFIISQGEQQTVFGKGGSVDTQLNTDKFNPNCKNSVKTPDGSEQRFDSQGLCKVRGNVHWGKSVDGLMEITVGGEGQQVKMYLDNKNWKLASVKGESSSYDSSMKLPTLKLEDKKAPEAPSAPPAGKLDNHVQRRQGQAQNHESAPKRDATPKPEAKADSSRPAPNHGAAAKGELAPKTEAATKPERGHTALPKHDTAIGGWKTEVKVAPKPVAPKAAESHKPAGPKVGEPLNILPENFRN